MLHIAAITMGQSSAALKKTWSFRPGTGIFRNTFVAALTQKEQKEIQIKTKKKNCKESRTGTRLFGARRLASMMCKTVFAVSWRISY